MWSAGRLAPVVAVTLFIVLGVTEGPRAGRGQSLAGGIYTEQQADRGWARYRDACESCHAPDLSGGKVVPEMVGDTFAARWTGHTVGQLLERIVVSMPVEDPASVSRHDKVDILAFILRANGFPVGETELSVHAPALERLAFEAP